MTRARWVHGEVLDALIRRRGVSAAAVAEAAQVSRSVISRLRTGSRTTTSDETAARIAAVLDVGVEVFTSPSADVIVVRHPDRHARCAP